MKIEVKYYFACLMIGVCFNSLGQSPQANLEKYWKYRERLKNFVIAGDCQGCGIPFNRAYNQLEVYDATTRMGYYIGMLAMEYKVLTNKGCTDPCSPPLSNTIHDLFYALEALNRLDANAEYWWGISISSTWSPDLNGFFIRDDIAQDAAASPGQPFLGLTDPNTGLKIENALNACLFPLPDGTMIDLNDCNNYAPNRMLDVYSSAFKSGMVGGTEESQDQVEGILVGLALVSKLVPSDVVYSCLGTNAVFYDNQHSLHDEAQSICDRMVGWMANGGGVLNPWVIFNPVTNAPVTNTGAYALLFSWGFQQAACQIETGFIKPTWLGNCVGGPSLSISAAAIVAADQVVTWPGLFSAEEVNVLACANSDNYRMMLTLGTIAGIWDFAVLDTYEYLTDAKVCSGNQPYMYEFIPMLHQILWGGGNIYYSNTYYEQLLDWAPCTGTSGHDAYPYWNGGDREWTGQGSYTLTSDYYNGIDYMYIFNMYNLSNSSYESMNECPDYYIPPQQLCPDGVTKTTSPAGSFTEDDTKNFYESVGISAGDNGVPGQTYTIANDNLSPPPWTPANVTFEAGAIVDLQPGFTASYGVIFDAKINTNINDLLTCIFENHNPIKNDSDNSIKTNIATDTTIIIVKPNPSKGIFSIILPSVSKNELDESASVNIFNTLGQQVYNNNLKMEKDNQIQVNFSDYPQGIYLILLKTKDKVFNRKLVHL